MNDKTNAPAEWAETIEARAHLIWEQDDRIGPYVKPDFDELSPQYRGRLRAMARRELGITIAKDASHD